MTISKHRSSPPQLPFFKREIPQMPEGYYSSGPNPNLAKFVEEKHRRTTPNTGSRRWSRIIQNESGSQTPLTAS